MSVTAALLVNVHLLLKFVELVTDVYGPIRRQLPGDLSLAIIVFLGPGPPDRHNFVEFDAVFWL